MPGLIFSKKRLLISLFQYRYFYWEIRMKIPFFETRTRNSFFQSRALRREREFLYSISCFETRNRKSFFMVEREKIKLILTRIPGIENSRYALVRGNPAFLWRTYFAWHLLRDTFCVTDGRIGYSSSWMFLHPGNEHSRWADPYFLLFFLPSSYRVVFFNPPLYIHFNHTH